MLAAGFAFTGLTIFTAVLAQTTRRASRVLSETLRPAALAGTMALLAALAALDAGFAMLALRAVAEVPIGVDREGATYRAFGVSTPTENVVLDEEGRVWVAGCSDFQVFRTVKELLVARGFLRY